MKRIAIYARVSLEGEGEDKKTQNPENQLKPLRALATTYEDALVVGEFVDRASGGSANRPEFQKLLTEVRSRRVDVILVWSLDRFSREGPHRTLAYLETLKNHKCALRSLQDGIDSSKGGAGEIIILVMAWVAKQERERISERTKAGLKGKTNLGRPKGRKDKKPRRKAGYYARWAKQKGIENAS